MLKAHASRAFSWDTGLAIFCQTDLNYCLSEQKTRADCHRAAANFLKELGLKLMESGFFSKVAVILKSWLNALT